MKESVHGGARPGKVVSNEPYSTIDVVRPSFLGAETNRRWKKPEMNGMRRVLEVTLEDEAELAEFPN